MSGLLEPLDRWNEALLRQVRPPTWVNPTPSGRYNLVVLGAGTAGLVTAAGAAGLGARVALVERQWLGGDCLNVGCVPSKTLIACSRDPRWTARGDEGFAGAMAELRRIRAALSPHDSAERFRRLGVDVFFGHARFQHPTSVTVDGQHLDFARAVIATGARARIPDVPGLNEVGCLTNETVFNLTRLPRRLLIIGGGPIGCELAQAFRRFGTSVTLLHHRSRLLDREDPEAGAAVLSRFDAEGIQTHLGTEPVRAGTTPNGRRITWRTATGTEGAAEADEILVAAGRVPNVDGLGLDAAGVAWDPRRGVTVDDHLRTTQRHIFAAGDVCLDAKFTHAADAAARVVVQNALFFGRKRLGSINIPRCTYTDPEVAHTGIDAARAKELGLETETWTRPFAEVDRARTDGNTDGFVKVLTRRGRGTILGATVVGSHAGDLISELSVAIAAGMTLGQLASVVHPYPTRAEIFRQLGDAAQRARLTPGIAALLRTLLRWRR